MTVATSPAVPAAGSLGDFHWPAEKLTRRRSAPLVIGLVNNMPAGAARKTEEQFRSLLAEAAPYGARFRLRLFTLPGIPRSDARHVSGKAYEDVGALYDERIGETLDGLIVTGMEPRAPDLTSEPYWPALTRLIDWANGHTTSTIWSCLAAHAAVRHCSGIARERSARKLSGVFNCIKAEDHVALAGMPPQWAVPHSRFNGLGEDALARNGYRILSRSADAGVDMFARQDGSLFLFLQGHPEYDAAALLREYRRDVSRFLDGHLKDCPDIPENYFHPDVMEALDAFRRRTMRTRRPDVFPQFPAIADAMLSYRWRKPAIAFFTAWLTHLVAERRERADTAALAVAPAP